ncbi:SPOR domain-containing protein [Treponema sp. OMZ 792]|uniref:SPOR domain-containing protein n=1 Tax=unclassified Treponema TaxID=2638727 RepID=UPI0020A32F3C|nr:MULTISPECIES: SPOR domain-containing protein [unclassified Treponema]UTC76117.1 SPOR domain-containing protein [Treponema sp. OMZ 792]UTC80119.1 SPOR domain-containing protein [Treponema sp. OMZ 798]
MEQKKILWIVLFISLFALIIFGVGLYLYAPFRNKSTMTAAEISDLGRIEADKPDTSVDPLQWTRNPDSIPPLEPESPTLVNIANNITVVNGEGQKGTTETSINVSDLTNTQKDEKTANLPENLAANLNTNQEAETKPSETEKQNSSSESKKQNSGGTSVKGLSSNPVEKPKTEKKTPPKPEKPAVKKSPAQKTVSTLYWVQTASLTSRLNAEAARDKLTAKHMKAEIFTKETATGITHRVRVGPFKNKTEAEYWLKKIKEIKGFEGSYVTQDRKKS